MKLPFFSRRVRFFGNVAIMILCAVFFLVPFAFRGARMSVSSVRNDVADWLPSDFPETKELDWFRGHFLGSQFVVVSWPGCSEDDDRFRLLVDKLRAESMETTHDGEAILAHDLGDRLGLHTTGNYHEDWGSHREKWLKGHGDKWYFITREGELYEWQGESNLMGWIARGTERFLHGKNRAEGRPIAQFGDPDDNEYYKDPRRLAGRFFETIMTGPDLFEQLAGPDGSLLRGRAEENEGAALDAQILAHQRLTGLVFGPTPKPGFDWSRNSFFNELTEKKQSELPDQWEQIYDDFLSQVIDEQYEGDEEALLAASRDKQLEHWLRLFARLRVEPPARQTCIVITLNSEVAHELARTVGRPVLGKPRGRILELAIGECGIPEEDLHMGGPPVDNVAIDEEGTITLIRLVSLSVIVGVILAYISFRSVNVTVMVFFIGSVAAVTSMGIVWYLGSVPDAVLMSMPALVYVLGLSGAVHIVNYYREACQENGPRGAAETAVRNGWFPCTLAAFTTSLGLISLYASNLIPIQKFGLFSALGTMATAILLFTYLPAALQIWPPGYKKIAEGESKTGGFHAAIGKFWDWVCERIIRHNKIVFAVGCVLLIGFGYGIFNIKTSVQLLKLFDADAKIIRDYEWLESDLGRLVPMELVVRVDPEAQATSGDVVDAEDTAAIIEERRKLSFLERIELAARIRRAVEDSFGEEGAGIVGHGMSTDVLVLPDKVSQIESPLTQERTTISGQIEAHYDELLQTGTLRVDPSNGEELWRISLRLGAFNNVDYGRFVLDLRRVVEPILAAYRDRNEILKTVIAANDGDLKKGRVLLLGWAEPTGVGETVVRPAALRGDESVIGGSIEVNQSKLYCETLGELLMNRGFSFGGRGRDKRAQVIIPEVEAFASWLEDQDRFASQLDAYDCVVLIRDHKLFDRELIESNSKVFVDATDHPYRSTLQGNFLASSTATEIRNDPEHPDHENTDVYVAYTGIVPIVYKAQRTLLRSLMDSIYLAFAMIALVMMILLRDWKRRATLGNVVNVPAGMVSMLPNVFPVVIIFGYMGHRGVEVDIGSMMTASVAMGIAVDDTIHFLNWFRRGLREGLSRLDAIRLAYRRVATAMTQTTLIAGFGLSVFALSTFTPTQRFGVLMLTLLFAALIGDLIFLPAILASPLGKLFQPKSATKNNKKAKGEASLKVALAGAGNVAVESEATADESGSELDRERAESRIDAAGEKRGTFGTPHVEKLGGDKSGAIKKQAPPADKS